MLLLYLPETGSNLLEQGHNRPDRPRIDRFVHSLIRDPEIPGHLFDGAVLGKPPQYLQSTPWPFSDRVRNEGETLIYQRESCAIRAHDSKEILRLLQVVNRRPGLMESRPIHPDGLFCVDGRADFADGEGKPNLDRIEGYENGHGIPKQPVGRTEDCLKLIAKRNCVRGDKSFSFLRVELPQAGLEPLLHTSSLNDFSGGNEVGH